VETAGSCVLQNRRDDRKVMLILYKAKANRAKGNILSAELFGFKIIGQIKIGD
jgi:hypothetical protein